VASTSSIKLSELQDPLFTHFDDVQQPLLPCLEVFHNAAEIND